GAEHQVVVFAEGHARALAIDLRGGGNDHLLALLVGVLEHQLGAVHVGLDGVDRAFHDELDAHRGGQVVHHVAAIDHLRQLMLVLERVDHVVKAFPAFEVFDVVDAAGREIVEDIDFLPLAEKFFGEMAADESGATRDQCSNRCHGDRLCSLLFPFGVVVNHQLSTVARSSGVEQRAAAGTATVFHTAVFTGLPRSASNKVYPWRHAVTADTFSFATSQMTTGRDCASNRAAPRNTANSPVSTSILSTLGGAWPRE